MSAAHVTLYWRRKNELFDRLGGVCANCGAVDSPITRLEVDHKDGRTWEPRKLSSHTRILKYLSELNAGVRLQLLCQKTNGGVAGLAQRFKGLGPFKGGCR